MDMKSIVIYSSKTGFTERYARWIAEDLQCTCKPIKDVKSSELSDYDCVIYGGWLMAGNIKDILKLRQLKGLGEKKIIIFAVGLTPMGEADIVEKMKETNLNEDEEERIPFFYFEGGLDYDRMGFLNKRLMKSLRKTLSKKKELSEGEADMLHKLENSCDGTDRAYIAPLVERVKSLADGE